MDELGEKRRERKKRERREREREIERRWVESCGYCSSRGSQRGKKKD